MLAHLELHPSRPREAQVDDRHVQLASDDVDEREAGTRRAAAVGDRGAVEDDGLGDAGAERRRRGDGGALVDADLDALDAVVERQVDEARLARRPGDGKLRPVGTADAPGVHVAPLAVRLLAVDVDAAHAGRRHVVHRQVLVDRHPLDDYALRVGAETELHAGRVVEHAAHAGVYVRGHGLRQPVVVGGGVVEGASFNRQMDAVDPLDSVLDLGGGDGHARIVVGDVGGYSRH